MNNESLDQDLLPKDKKEKPNSSTLGLYISSGFVLLALVFRVLHLPFAAQLLILSHGMLSLFLLFSILSNSTPLEREKRWLKPVRVLYAGLFAFISIAFLLQKMHYYFFPRVLFFYLFYGGLGFWILGNFFSIAPIHKRETAGQATAGLILLVTLLLMV